MLQDKIRDSSLINQVEIITNFLPPPTTRSITGNLKHSIYMVSRYKKFGLFIERNVVGTT